MNTILGIACVLLSVTGDAPVTAYVTLDPPIIPFHRQAQYSIVVEAPNDLEVTFPNMVDKFGGLGVADVRRDTTALRHNMRRITETYVLDPIFAAAYKIYPAEIRWGDNQSVTVPSVALRVRDLTKEEKKEAEEFQANAGLIPVPNAFEQAIKEHPVLWAGGIAAVIAAFGISAYLYRRRKRKAVLAPPPPAWEVAYQRLRELDRRQLPKAGKYEPYYVDLSAILRYYIEDRFLLHAPEQTTQEFLAVASGSHLFSDEHQKLLSQFLKHSDYVKFAQYVPTQTEMENCFAAVLQFVDETTPKPDTGEQLEAAA